MVRRKRYFFDSFGFSFPFLNITVSRPSRLELLKDLKESKSYYEDLRDEINEEIADIDKEINRREDSA